MGIFAPWIILAALAVISLFAELFIETFKNDPWL
jgi:hypothetical protein